MSHIYKIKTSRPLDRDYNAIGVNEGDDVVMSIPIKDEWVGQGYNLTIYDEITGSTLFSIGADINPKEIKLESFAFDTNRALIDIEDRSDINNINTIETIGYIYFKKFKKGATVPTEVGAFQYTQADGSTISIKYYTTSFNDI